MTPDPGFKVMVVLRGEYLENDAFYRHIYYRMLTGNIGKLSNSVTFDALECCNIRPTIHACDAFYVLQTFQLTVVIKFK